MSRFAATLVCAASYGETPKGKIRGPSSREVDEQGADSAAGIGESRRFDACRMSRGKSSDRLLGQQPAENVGAWPNFRRGGPFFRAIVGRKLGPASLHSPFQRIASVEILRENAKARNQDRMASAVTEIAVLLSRTLALSSACEISVAAFALSQPQRCRKVRLALPVFVSAESQPRCGPWSDERRDLFGRLRPDQAVDPPTLRHPV